MTDGHLLRPYFLFICHAIQLIKMKNKNNATASKKAVL